MLDGIGVLSAVVEAGSFVGAGEVLGLTQSGVSRSIARLEERVGVRLFQRNARAVVLTEEGRRFYERVTPLIAGLEEEAGEAAGASAEPRGYLRVVVDPLVARILIGPRVATFLAQNPLVSVDVVVRDRLGDMVADGFDVAVRFGEPESSSLIARKLLETRVLTCAAPAYLQRRGTPKTPRELTKHECILFRDAQTGRPFEWIFRRGAKSLHVTVAGLIHRQRERDPARGLRRRSRHRPTARTRATAPSRPRARAALPELVGGAFPTLRLLSVAPSPAGEGARLRGLRDRQRPLRFAHRATGRVGGIAADTLLAKGHAVRAVVRTSSKGSTWKQRGADVAVADSLDRVALARALRDVDRVFIMVPPDFTPSKGFPETGAIIRSIRDALVEAKPPKLVALSSIGAQHDHGIGLINNSYMLERALASLPTSSAFLRPGWFMENAAGDIEPARLHGSIDSFLQPTTRAVPMVATADIGRVVAELLLEDWRGRRVVELEGPRRISPQDIANVLGRALGRDVAATPMPRERWASIFEAQGAAWPEPRIEMIDGFNAGWIEFEGEPLHGRIGFEEVAMDLLCKNRGTP